MWFRRDLRLEDHPALRHAGRDGREVVALFVIDPALVRPSGVNRLAFMYRSLRSLDASIDARLIIRHGDPVDVVGSVAEEASASEVVVSRDFAPYGRRRDAAVAARLAAMDVDFVGRGSPYVLAPGTVVKADGSPFSVFSPFFRAWSEVAPPPQLDDVAPLWHGLDGLRTDGVPEDPVVVSDLPPAGEAAAHEHWHTFLGDGLDHYDTRRNSPARPGSSRMSPYLRWGQVHPRQLIADLDEQRRGHATFRKELVWREFYADVLFNHPSSARENLQPKMDAMDLDTDDAARQRFDAWKVGRTGFPIVDAGMRQMLATGWMHNRVRMITASFLVKDLHLPWQWGARHMMQHFVDGDLASNQHGFQWVAGTGTDPAPYFRVFNPALQGEKFDPDGEYIRRWVPELAGLAGSQIHAIAKAKSPLPAGAIAPIVDHATERTEALRRYQAVTGR